MNKPTQLPNWIQSPLILFFSTAVIHLSTVLMSIKQNMQKNVLPILCGIVMLLFLITGGVLTATLAAAAQYRVDGIVTVQEPTRVAVPTTLSCRITYVTSTDAPNLIPHPAPNQPVQFFVDGIEVGQAITDENGYAQTPHTFATPGVHAVRAYSATTIVYDSMNAALGRWSVDVTTSITVFQAVSSPTPSPSVSGLPTGTTASVNNTTATTTTTLPASASTSSALPGFEAIIAVIGIIAVAYLLMRDRDNCKK
jgi:PGF-CTERM protein